jgi:hypothetical protein
MSDVKLAPLAMTVLQDFARTTGREHVMNLAHKPAHREARMPRIYSPELQPLLQALLATLADIDFAFESDLETIQESAADETLKQQAMARLQARRGELRAPYLRQLAKLEERINALTA